MDIPSECCGHLASKPIFIYFSVTLTKFAESSMRAASLANAKDGTFRALIRRLG